MAGGVALVVVGVLLLQLRRSRRRLALLEAQVRSLSVYSAIADVEAHVEQLRQQGRQQLALAAEEGQRLIEDARRQAAELTASAEASAGAITAKAMQGARDTEQSATTAADAMRAEANRLAEHARQNVATATARADEIVKQAELRAKEIAGEALAAVHNAKQAEETVRALKNVIEGYGDAYIVPTQDLIDELGESYAHTDAGEQLKAVRARMRAMIKDGTAAACDYVEDVRKSTAIDFVTDAFNGKVATVLASVREDNYGTLAQKIRDASALVNNNGKAFRNARITPEFVEVRLQELKWAVAVQEIKERDREEQRLLKERIREEERAQREFEKALKDAEKEEDLLRKAMEKAQSQFDKATDEQKQKYEEQLKALAARLHDAEEKGKRALSMAQQTKSGHVYVISNVGSFGEHVYKIGLTRRLEPLDRIRELGDASVPFDFDVHALIPSNDAPALEYALHKQFVRAQVNKVNPRKEFFRINLVDVRREIERVGVQAAWTMTAECRQYKETIALERAMKDKSFPERAWIKHQVEEHDRAAVGADALE